MDGIVSEGFFRDLAMAMAAAAIPVVATFVAGWLRSLMKLREVDASIAVMEDVRHAVDMAVRKAVASVNQTYVSDARGPDGLAPESRIYAQRMALTETKRLLTDKTKTLLHDVYGSVDGYLTTMIEAAVLDQKTRRPLP